MDVGKDYVLKILKVFIMKKMIFLNKKLYTKI
jgi:hypothetical protein